jgi:hypothetical protein
MKRGRDLLVVAFAAAVALAATPAVGQGSVSVSLHRRAMLGEGGSSLQLIVDIACDDLGTEEFQEGLAFATQRRGPLFAEGEGGVDGSVICDGMTRTYTATVSLFEGSRFRGGPASATVDFLICFIVDNENQVCEHGVDTRTVLVAGRA